MLEDVTCICPPKLSECPRAILLTFYRTHTSYIAQCCHARAHAVPSCTTLCPATQRIESILSACCSRNCPNSLASIAASFPFGGSTVTSAPKPAISRRSLTGAEYCQSMLVHVLPLNFNCNSGITGGMGGDYLPSRRPLAPDHEPRFLSAVSSNSHRHTCTHARMHTT